jgi:hypothetical protein
VGAFYKKSLENQIKIVKSVYEKNIVHIIDIKFLGCTRFQLHFAGTSLHCKGIQLRCFHGVNSGIQCGAMNVHVMNILWQII